MNYDFGKAKLKVELARIKLKYAELTLPHLTAKIEMADGTFIPSSVPEPTIRDAACRVERYRVKLRLREIEVERLTANQKGNLT